MFAPCSANVRATSSSRRGRSHESTAICTRKLVEVVAPSHDTGVIRSGLRKRGRAAQLRVGKVLLLQGLFERLTPLGLGVLARLAREPLADLVARARALRERHPVARRAAALLRRENLDEVAVLQLVVQR